MDGPNSSENSTQTALRVLIEADLGVEFDKVTFLAESPSATIFTGVQRSIGRRVAIKVFPEVVLSDISAEHPEVQSHAGLSWHPHIATVFDSGLTQHRQLWMSIELCPTNLQARLERHPLDPTAVLEIACQLLEALQAIHTAGLLHCDIKPGNVLLAQDDGVRVTDFGIAKAKHGVLPTLDYSRGTLHFMAPEVLEGAFPTAAADMWGVGATLWAAVHGHEPYQESTSIGSTLIAALNSVPDWEPPPTFVGPEAERVRSMIALCLNHDPSARPTATELLNIARRPLVSDPIVTIAPAASPKRGLAVMAAVATVALLGAAFGLKDEGRGSLELLNTTPVKWCNAIETADQEIADSLAKATRNVVASGYSARSVRDAVRGFPAEVAAATSNWKEIISLEPNLKVESKDIVESRLVELMVAEAATYLATGEVISSGSTTTATANLDGLSKELGRTASAFNKVIELSATNCGTTAPSWREEELVFLDAVKQSFESSPAPFFEGPASDRSLPTSFFTTVLAVQPEYFSKLVLAHPHWLIELTSPGATSIRSLLIDKHSKVVKAIALESPIIARYLLGEDPALPQRDGRNLYFELTAPMSDSEAMKFEADLRELTTP